MARAAVERALIESRINDCSPIRVAGAAIWAEGAKYKKKGGGREEGRTCL
jgi:hypothetical protein